jgi:hypothetical protein
MPSGPSWGAGASWSVDEAVVDLAAVDRLLAGLPAATAEERLAAVAEHFTQRYGPDRGRHVLGAFLRVCLYLERHGEELRARGLVTSEAGRGAAAGPTAAGATSIERGFLTALVAAATREVTEEIVAEVPAREVPEDAVEP